MRMLDLDCRKCGEQFRDLFLRHVPETLVHWDCGGELEQIYMLDRRAAQWSDRDAVVVYQKPDGTFSYPGMNNRPTPPGCERIVMRSLREVERFEKQHHVVNEAMHYDRGSGTRRLDD